MKDGRSIYLSDLQVADETPIAQSERGLYRLTCHFRSHLHENEMLVPCRRDACAALRLMRRLLKKQSLAPKLLVIDKLRSYSSIFLAFLVNLPA